MMVIWMNSTVGGDDGGVGGMSGSSNNIDLGIHVVAVLLEGHRFGLCGLMVLKELFFRLFLLFFH